ncbi:phosphomannomutase [Pelagibacterium sp.]|uniref:phosphomannomutase n=1 Tax=Pelagibacterium sp. TaxID=1967288 RepID=UPI003A8F1557
MSLSSVPSVKFGTSGLRGRSEAFSADLVCAYVGGFLDTACATADSRQVAIARDLRDSSPLIAARVAASISALGWHPINCGTVPTPALAAYALARRIPAIMVTGSHIPADYNGLKFYRPDGELLKSDEAAIEAEAKACFNAALSLEPTLPDPDPTAESEYRARYRDAFAPTALAGLNIAVFQHSAVGRDALAQLLEALGAIVKTVGRSEEFVAVDTEALEPEAMVQIKAVLDTGQYHVVVSTDGDGDRPLIVDATGTQINGDLLGALTARFIGARTIVTPLTSTSALEQSQWFDTIARTRIGSPFVVEKMAQINTDAIAGFEANGGFLLQSDFALAHGTLKRLPTRDAVLPIVAVLAAVAARRVSITDLVTELPRRVMRAARLKDIVPDHALELVENLARSSELRAGFAADLAHPVTIDTTDGTRLTTEAGDVIHFRPSGNAPELRCYVETANADQTSATLSIMMAALERHLSTGGNA